MESPNSQSFLQKMKEIQEDIIKFIDEESYIEENFPRLIYKFDESKICDNKHEIQAVLHLISKIANNHHRSPNFFHKIEQILMHFKDIIKKYFSNSEIFTIFKGNKKILLFLIEEKMMIFDEYVAKKITKRKFVKHKYPQYFQPEIQPFINEKWFPKYVKTDRELSQNEWVEDLKKEIPENFEDLRKEGEHESLICQFIRQDSVIEFIKYINKNNISLNQKVDQSIYDTNSFFVKERIRLEFDKSLIEYAAFFGSIQIFNYMIMQKVKIYQHIWPFAIHGNNDEIIYHLVENNVEPEDKTYKKCLKESLKCHHNGIAHYLLNNFIKNEEDNSPKLINKFFKYHNYVFLENDLIDKSFFYSLCKYGHYILAYNLLQNEKIDINERMKKQIKRQKMVLMQ